MAVMLAVVVLGFTTCGGDDDNGNDYSHGYFIIKGDKEYKYPNTGYGTSSLDAAGRYQVMVLSSASFDLDPSYGDYSGISVTFTHTLNGAGVYNIVSQKDFVSALANNATPSDLMVVSATVGGTVGKGSYYEFTNGMASVKLIDGKYHITISNPVSGEKKTVVGDSNLPATVTLKVEDGHVWKAD